MDAVVSVKFSEFHFFSSFLNEIQMRSSCIFSLIRFFYLRRAVKVEKKNCYVCNCRFIKIAFKSDLQNALCGLKLFFCTILKFIF